jgi:predicted Zn-dependent protease
MPPRESRQDLTPRDRIRALLEGAIERSPADETELVWLEARHSTASWCSRQPEIEQQHVHTILVRVLDHGRFGSHRIGTATAGDLDNAVRAAVAQSRGREPLPGLPHLPADEGELPRLPRLRDSSVARLDARGIERWLGKLRSRSETARLRWADARVAVFSSRGVRRGVSATALELTVQAGRGAASGLARDAARSLEELPTEQIFDRARRRRSRDEPGKGPAEPGAAVLSPEATADLVALLGHQAFSATAYYEDGSLLREHLGVQVFDRALDLSDDATDPAGLPFPFDLEGTPKRRVELIDKGIPRTPALDQRQAAVLGLPPTAHAVGGADARAENLFLATGEHEEDALLGLADGGLWVGRLDRLECFEPRRLQIRAILRGLRRIRDGQLAEPVPDMVWESSLLRSFADIAGVGAATSRSLGPTGYLGGCSAPALVLTLA